MARSTRPDVDAEERGFNLPERSLIWRDAILPRLVIPLFWLYWLGLLPAKLVGLRAKRRNLSRASKLAIESGLIGWTQVFFEELLSSAEEFLGGECVCQVKIDRSRHYIPQLKEAMTLCRPTHALIDVRTPQQNWRGSLTQGFRASWILHSRGITPIVIMTDAFYRRQRFHAAVLSAHSGIVVTFASAGIVKRIFPHSRLIGPLFMPISRRRLHQLTEALSARRLTPVDSGNATIRFIGNIYPPRDQFLQSLEQKLRVEGLSIDIRGDKSAVSNEEYWSALVDADIIVTTTLQGPDRPFMDWIWIQQAVFRFSEAMGAGSALVASEVENIDSFFKPGRDFIEFVTVNEARDAIVELSNDPITRRRVAEAGRKRIAELIESDSFWVNINGALAAAAVTRASSLS